MFQNMKLAFKRSKELQTEQNNNLLPGHAGYFRYTFIERIGKGGQGSVYLAKEKLTDKKVAIKLININGATTSRQTYNEIILLKSNNHRNLLKLHDTFISPKTTNAETFEYVFLVLELVDSTLDLVIQKKHIKLSILNISYITYQIVCGIHYLHSNGIIHKDIKSQNIGIYRNYDIKLLDYGIVQKDNGTVTQRGTEIYKAPEMLANQHCTNSVDIWPVGVLLSEMILRRLFDFTRGNALNQLRDGTFMWDKIFNDKKFPAYDRKTESSFDRLKQALVCGRIKSTANQKDTNNSVKKCYVTSENTRDLLKQLLKTDPAERISAQDALNHRFLKVWKKDDEINATPIEFSEEIGDCNLIGLDMKEHLLNKVNELADTFQKQNTVTV